MRLVTNKKLPEIHKPLSGQIEASSSVASAGGGAQGGSQVPHRSRKDSCGYYRRYSWLDKRQYLKTAQVAQWLNVSESTVRKWVHYRFIPHVKLGRAVRFSEEEIEKWLKERAEAGRTALVPEINWE
jgi:excisionase family DNA binding protein